jgi:hypothetical protein
VSQEIKKLQSFFYLIEVMQTHFPDSTKGMLHKSMKSRKYVSLEEGVAFTLSHSTCPIFVMGLAT